MTDKVRDQLEDFIIWARFASPKPTTTDLVNEIVDAILEKFDVTEKPDPIGLITVSRDDSQAFRVITIKVAKSEWIDIFLDADQPERATVQRRKTPVGTSLDREVFRP
ncbi:hypothetical protein SEA_DUSSY_68 [Mycobacterium phage Dussy]|nr:hypothetical protein SEA_DUSSY_68 [Mycobacterium phage Dussy]UJQ86988.1 hypothetical protein SEA_ABBYSHOES_69 [Mycobacterium phage Abbyshoes]UVD39663.1 hypothetical protein SEA_KENMECH_71 [Mycobacterium phage Kenmech]